MLASFFFIGIRRYNPCKNELHHIYNDNDQNP
jgi:hypothetical protein